MKKQNQENIYRLGNLQYEERQWGSFETVFESPGYKVKRITVKPGKRTSLQWHEKRNEEWNFVQGDRWETNFKFDIEDDLVRLSNPLSQYIPRKAVHRIHNTGAEDLVLIEIQTSDEPDGCDENDIHRIEDDFGRSIK